MLLKEEISKTVIAPRTEDRTITFILDRNKYIFTDRDINSKLVEINHKVSEEQVNGVFNFIEKTIRQHNLECRETTGVFVFLLGITLAIIADIAEYTNHLGAFLLIIGTIIITMIIFGSTAEKVCKVCQEYLKKENEKLASAELRWEIDDKFPSSPLKLHYKVKCEGKTEIVTRIVLVQTNPFVSDSEPANVEIPIQPLQEQVQEQAKFQQSGYNPPQQYNFISVQELSLQKL